MIAITGMAGRFPGAKTVDEFWENLCNGVESISRFTPEELAASGVPADLIAHPDYVPARGILEDIELFDAGFFGYSPREAELLDPQHRVLLECAWEALESAGCNPETYHGKIGVFVGMGDSHYLHDHLHDNPALADSVSRFQMRLACAPDTLATRIAYKLNLRGPAIDVQTACSTSLVAVHMACQSLLAGDCDIALAGGVSITLPQKTGYLYREGMILSRDGHCRAFDAQASGTVGGNGAGLIVLRRADARDRALAFIAGSAVNNDGATKVSFTAPGVAGQCEVVSKALAGIHGAKVGYVETHGTATAMGDPIEIEALEQAFEIAGVPRTDHLIGSVKTNIGHLDTAAGIAGLIKTVLILSRGKVPPSLHFQQPNPDIRFGRFKVATSLTAPRPFPVHAAVSSFGIGGTNAHVVLAANTDARGSNRDEPSLLVWSARSDAALDAATTRLAEHFERHPETRMDDASFTLCTGRRWFGYRRMLVAGSAAEAASLMRNGDSRRVFSATARDCEPPVVFLFPGQGTQQVGMAKELYDRNQGFRERLNSFDRIAAPMLGRSILSLIYPDAARAEEARELLRETRFAQVALFVVEAALALQFGEWGVRPAAALGHSIGEFVAAFLAGVFTLEVAIALVVARGRLMQDAPPGAMLAVSMSEDEISARLGAAHSLAAVNGPRQCVVAGATGDIEGLELALRAEGIECQRLDVSHAFHSATMDAAAQAFTAKVREVRLNPPSVKFISCVTGTWITPEQATDPAYWGRQLRATVRFSDGLEEVMKERGAVLLEVGPKQVLSGLARTHPAKPKDQAVVPTLAGPHSLLAAVGRLAMEGVAVDWDRFFESSAAVRIPLPAYPFERQRHWVEAPGAAAPGRYKNPADWFSRPVWKRTPPLAFDPASLPECTAIFPDTHGVGSALEKRLAALGKRVVAVESVEELAASGIRPQAFVHTGSLEEGSDPHLSPGFRSLLHLAQAIGRMNDGQSRRILAVTRGMFDVTGTEPLFPIQATLSGLLGVIPKEYPAIACQCVDVELPASDHLAAQLVAELARPAEDNTVALRGAHRWTLEYERLSLANGVSRIRERGVYAITGGTRGIGLAIARDLAKNSQARLALIGRTPVGFREDLGEFMTLAADAADIEQMRAALQQVRARFGGIDGVIHAAGVPGETLLMNLTPEAAVKTMAAKVRGAQILRELLRETPPDFLALFSSLNAILPTIGQADYVGANAFLDAYANALTREPGPFTISMNWDGWLDIGMAADAAKRLGMKPNERFLTPAEGVEAFRMALRATVPQVVICTRPLRSAETAAPVPRQERPARAASYESDTQRAVAEVWREFLGVSDIGIHDHFLDLGGDSLVGTRIVARLREKLCATLPLAVIFETPTVAGISAAIAAHTAVAEADEWEELVL